LQCRDSAIFDAPTKDFGQKRLFEESERSRRQFITLEALSTPQIDYPYAAPELNLTFWAARGLLDCAVPFLGAGGEPKVISQPKRTRGDLSGPF